MCRHVPVSVGQRESEATDYPALGVPTKISKVHVSSGQTVDTELTAKTMASQRINKCVCTTWASIAWGLRYRRSLRPEFNARGVRSRKLGGFLRGGQRNPPTAVRVVYSSVRAGTWKWNEA